MDKVKITVIVPVYNVEDYLQRCVESLLGQTFKDFNVILVDDGSTDSSGKLCDEFSALHPFIKTIHKENGGLSDARNAAYPYIDGEYVMFLDSDDFLTPDALDLLYGYAGEKGCQVVQGGFYYFYEQAKNKGRLIYDNRWFGPKSKPFTLTREDAIKELIKNNYLKNFAWGKLYKADIVKQFPFPKGRFFEDSYWQHLVIDKTKKVGIVPAPTLYYLQRGTSISGTFNGKSIDLLYGLEERLKFMKEKYPEYQTLMKKELIKAIGLHYTVSQRNKDPKIREHFRKYLEEAKERIPIKPNELFKIKHSSLLGLLRLPKRVYGRLFGKKQLELLYDKSL